MRVRRAPDARSARDALRARSPIPMPRFIAEPPFAHDRAPKVGVLLVNLGTPDAPTAAAVRRYLAEFLSDPRVVEIPRVGVEADPATASSCACGRRSRRRKYAAIWTQGRLAAARAQPASSDRCCMGYLGQRLKARACRPTCARSSSACATAIPTSAARIDRLRAAGCDRILVLPLYPQYAASTTASAFDAVSAHVRAAAADAGAARRSRLPRRSRVHQGARAERQRLLGEARAPRPPRAVVSRPAAAHARPAAIRTTAIARRRRACSRSELGLDAEQWALTFQSRFGKAQWLKPYTVDAARRAGARRARRASTSFCPGFVADCLETLEEIGIEGAADVPRRPAARIST